MNSNYSTSFTRLPWKTLNPHMSATKQDRDMGISALESLLVLVSDGMEI